MLAPFDPNHICDPPPHMGDSCYVRIGSRRGRLPDVRGSRLRISAVCGPVGDCNTVQQSEYARLFGILPIGLLGMAGYLAIGTAWLVNRLAEGRLANLATISIWVLSALGTLFSIYLTFLEPFVIGATCAWCLTSAVLMTTLMLISVLPGKLAIGRLSLPSNTFWQF